MRWTDPRLRRIAPLLIGASLLAASGTVHAQTREYEVKAEFIERFTRFIEWPAKAFSDDESTFVFCIAGQNPFGAYLDNLVRERRIQNRKTVLRSVADPSSVDGCHLLFLAKNVRSRVGPLVARAAGRPILTVGDSEGLAQVGVLVNFYVERTHVRFEVNAKAVKTSGLKFSSRLLKLARIVSPEQDP